MAALAAATVVLLSPGFADAVIFQDGFESGDANAWSGVVPVRPLLLSEISVRPDEAEFFEIGNPNPVDIELANIYIADYNLYYLITIGGGAPGIADFRAQFPASAIISAHDVVVVSVRSAADFFWWFGQNPDYDFDAGDPGAPAMLGEIDDAVFTNADEMLILFEWDGSADLVQDHDYFLWGNASDAMDKSGVVVGSSAFEDETLPVFQDYAVPPDVAQSLKRIDLLEGSEITSGGNGITGHDETSENLSTTTDVSDSPTPGTGS